MVIAVGLMLVAADPLARFIGRNPTVVMLALGFLLMIGAVLIADGFGVHVPKGYIYAAMAFSGGVEALNIGAARASGKAAQATQAIEQRRAKSYARGMTVHFHEEDLPAGVFAPGAALAVDTETMGLITPRDRLCVVQISDGARRRASRPLRARQRSMPRPTCAPCWPIRSG